MPIFVRIPTPLRRLTSGQKTVEVVGNTVSEVLRDLDAKYPGIGEKLYDKETLRPLFNLYLNKEDIRFLKKVDGKYEVDMNNPVKDGDQLSIIPPIAGGVGRR